MDGLGISDRGPCFQLAEMALFSVGVNNAVAGEGREVAEEAGEAIGGSAGGRGAGGCFQLRGG